MNQRVIRKDLVKDRMNEGGAVGNTESVSWKEGCFQGRTVTNGENEEWP